ncbi:hypothetical protein [Campylobacter taeniopygiae]|uniref:hypothetical protein n=1 Tax=Campylobacter taeniopygiae TaxID=2510188 RepID=UPI001484DAB5|nr:hypothetical protein [Campylobacter taeniopygiae]
MLELNLKWYKQTEEENIYWSDDYKDIISEMSHNVNEIAMKIDTLENKIDKIFNKQMKF